MFTYFYLFAFKISNLHLMKVMLFNLNQDHNGSALEKNKSASEEKVGRAFSSISVYIAPTALSSISQ